MARKILGVFEKTKEKKDRATLPELRGLRKRDTDICPVLLASKPYLVS